MGKKSRTHFSFSSLMMMDWRSSIQKRFQKYSLKFDSLNLEIKSSKDFASVALILISGKKGPGLLFIKRQHNPEDPWSGHMALPGGRTETNEGPVETAMRESLEEIGLVLNFTRVVLDPVEARARQSFASFLIYPCLFLTDFHWDEISLNLSLCPHEVESVHFFSLTQLLDPAYQSQVHWSIGQRNLELPSIQIGRHTIWGLTYWILEKFFRELEGLQINDKDKVDLSAWKSHPKI